MNNGILSSGYEPPDMPHGLLGRPTSVSTPRGRAQRYAYEPRNLTLVYDTSLEPANLTVSVPLGGTVDVTIDWGDGTYEAHTTTGFKTHTYDRSGIYVVQVSGRMTAFNYTGSIPTSDNKPKLVRCLSFGEIGLTNLSLAFRGCANLVQCPSVLPSTVTGISDMFQNCIIFNDPNVSLWNTSNVSGSLSTMFTNCTAFNQPIEKWNVSRITIFGGMFGGASNFNQPLGRWDMSSATNIGGMFSGATRFRQPVSEWNVFNVVQGNQIFVNAQYNQNICGWDIRKCATLAAAISSHMGVENYSAALIAWAALADDDLRTQAITAFASASGGTATTVTSANHGMVAGSRVNISGTTNYNGDYNVVSTSVNTTFVIPVAFVANDATGTMRNRRARNVVLSAGPRYTSAAASARDTLVNTYGWVITDGGPA